MSSTSRSPAITAITAMTRISKRLSERAAYTDHTEIIVIGGGFGGLLTGARLKEAGFNDLRLIEKGSDFGGTWYWNRYPGAACDTEAYIYLPLCEELGYVPKNKYAFAPKFSRTANTSQTTLTSTPMPASAPK